jgi:hypothetical protein
VAEASIMARLLGWRLLTLDASVVLLPANAPPTDAGIVTLRRDPWRRRAATRGRLREAMKNIDQAGQELALARAHEPGRRASEADATSNGGSLTLVRQTAPGC